MSIESLLIIAVATFYFSVVPRCFGSDSFMSNVPIVAEEIQRMYALVFCVCVNSPPLSVCISSGAYPK